MKGKTDMAANEKTDNQDAATQRKKPNAIGLVILLVLIVTGLIFGYLWLTDTLTYVSTDNSTIDGEHINISARILGRIKKITAAEGDSVKDGEVIVILDDSDLRAQEKQVAAALNSAKQTLTLSQITLDRTESDFKRTETLYKTGAVTKEQYDHAGNALDTARAQYAIAQSQVDTAHAQRGVIEAQLLNTRITTPIRGVIAKQVLHPGDIVQPGQTICTINNLESIWITANFEETKIRLIKRDAPVEISIDAYPGKKLMGRIDRISAGIVPPPFSIGEFTKTTQRIPVKILFDSIPDYMVLLPGMSVEVKVRIK
ncbi:MAG: HlyD family secretion protein [Spirochaetales bacterium]|nr:HlyD family secretion protein [Spirochaetales bacterium]